MPTVDGKGQSSPKEKTPQQSVEGSPNTGAPNEFGRGGAGFHGEGPNPGGSGKK